MKILPAVLLLCFLAFIPAMAQESGYITDPDGYTNLRSGPSAKSGIIGIIPEGQVFNYYPDNNSDWFKVDFGYRTGYVHKSRIKSINIAKSEISNFFKEFNSIDRNNVESGEADNKKLYRLTGEYPLAAVNAFCEQDRKIQEFLISEFRSPVNDGIDLQLIYSRMQNLKPTCPASHEISEALKTAANKSGLVLKNTSINFSNIPEENKPAPVQSLTNIQFTGTIDGRSITFYLNQPRIDPFSKMFYQGQFQLADNDETYGFLDSVITKNKATRPFYFFVFNSAVGMADGAIAEVMAETCLEFFTKYPCTFFKYSISEECRVDMPKWAELIAFQLNDKAGYIKLKARVDKLLNSSCSSYLNEWTEFQKELENNLEE